MASKRHKILLLSFIAQFFICSCFSGCHDGPYFDKLGFHKLEVKNSIQTSFVESFFECLLQCPRFPNCLSLNVAVKSNQKGLYECVLLSEAAKQFPGLLRPSQLYDHHSRRFMDSSGNNISKKKASCDGTTPLGMENRAIPDNHITASSVSSRHYLPANGRLNMKVSQDYTNLGTWKASRDDQNQWLQVDLGKVTMVTGIATQGAPRRNMYVSSYSLQYSVDGLNFQDYEGGKILSGNSDQSTVVKNALKPPIKARYIRVRPNTWYFSIAMRMELYGC